MIELDLEPYCDNCPHFEAKSNVSRIYGSFSPDFVDTTIKCKNAEKCREIERYLKERIKSND